MHIVCELGPPVHGGRGGKDRMKDSGGIGLLGSVAGSGVVGGGEGGLGGGERGKGVEGGKGWLVTVAGCVWKCAGRRINS